MPFVIWKIQIKTSLRFYTCQTAKINKSNDNSCQQGCGIMGTLISCLLKHPCRGTGKNSLADNQRDGNRYNPRFSYSTLEPIHSKHLFNYFHCCSIHNINNWQQLKYPSTGKWVSVNTFNQNSLRLTHYWPIFSDMGLKTQDEHL